MAHGVIFQKIGYAKIQYTSSPFYYLSDKGKDDHMVRIFKLSEYCSLLGKQFVLFSPCLKNRVFGCFCSFVKATVLTKIEVEKPYMTKKQADNHCKEIMENKRSFRIFLIIICY